jgi:pimeloyl-ACP methyl ester carboxylesterase
MFGIRGLDPFGLVHALLGVAALILGLAVLLGQKGHASTDGSARVLTMFLLNATALTRASWHKVANRLARRFRVVATDLRGYGDSIGPAEAFERFFV